MPCRNDSATWELRTCSRGSASGKQNFLNNAYTNDAIKGIRGRTGGMCTFGLTMIVPQAMRRYADWANDHGGHVSVVDNYSTGRFGSDIAKEQIARGYPVVLLISTTSTLPDHYVVAHKRASFMGQDQFYVNYGWPGGADDPYVTNYIHWAGAAVPAP